MENKQTSSYTPEELVEFEKYIEKTGDDEVWQTLDGDRIPFKFIKEDHLKNIISHLKQRLRLSTGYPRSAVADLNKTLTRMETLYKRKLIKKSPAARVLYANK